MKKILYTATSDVHLRTFHIPYLKWLKSQGFEVHIAAAKRGEVNFDFCDSVYYLPFMRSPFHWKNIEAYFSLKKIINNNNYDLIHCHTPTVSVLTRIAAAGARRKGTKVLYTPHGYHFFKGAPLRMWLIYYPIEKLLSALTDEIITINKEDYDLTRKCFWNKHTYYIKGIGVDDKKFITLDAKERAKQRKRYGYSDDDFLILYTAEFNARKNHQFLIHSLPKLKKTIPSLKLVLIGTGSLFEVTKRLAQDLDLMNTVKFWGWRDDVSSFAAIADIGVSTSKQEGLPIGVLEKMLCSVPLVVTNERGHRELIRHGVNGFMFEHGDQAKFIQLIEKLYQDPSTRAEFGVKAYEKAQEFLIEKSLASMAEIYTKLQNGRISAA